MPRKVEYVRYRVVCMPPGGLNHILYAETLAEAGEFFRAHRGTPRTIEASRVPGGSESPWDVLRHAKR